MPQVYFSDQPIPELQGSIRGAATIVLTKPSEVESVQSLCLLAGRPVETPTIGIFQALTTSRLDLLSWTVQRQRLGIHIEEGFQLGDSWGRHDDTHNIVAALGLAGAIWKNQGDDISNLFLTLSVKDPAREPESVIEVEGENPGLMLFKGSLSTTLFLGAFKAGGFVVGLFSARGIGVEDRANRIVEDLRTKKLEVIPRVQSLPRLDQAQAGDFGDKCAVIVLLHGLLSTDLGTFDGLISYLRKEGFDRTNLAFVGWPHDTTTQVDYNARDLSRDLDHVFGRSTGQRPSIAFVCHSRGGLVARYTAAMLFKRDLQRWQQRIRGCVTFGTPHLGTGLADAPDKLIAALLAAEAWKANGQLAPFSDVLWVAKTNQVLEGVEDLRPLRGKSPERGRDPFQKTLEDLERAADVQRDRILDILAVGGRVPHASRWYYDLAGRALAGVEHDCAVPLSSSQPRWFVNKTSATDCDHFGYFSEAETQKVHYAAVAGYLRKVLDWDGCQNRNKPKETLLTEQEGERPSKTVGNRTLPIPDKKFSLRKGP